MRHERLPAGQALVSCGPLAARPSSPSARGRLAPFSGLLLQPSKWLHITTLVAGATDVISLDQGHAMLTAVSRLFADVPPRFGRASSMGFSSVADSTSSMIAWGW